MFLSRKRRKLAQKLDELLATDPKAAVELYASSGKDLARRDAARIADAVDHYQQARENREYLSRALAEGQIAPTAAFELLEVFEDAGYVTPAEYHMLRRHIVQAHRQAIRTLLAEPRATRFDYFAAIDAFRTAGYLTDEELAGLERLVDGKLNPAKAARWLFADAEAALDAAEHERLLYRYLVEFEGYPDYADAASLYLAARIDQLWKHLPTVRSARLATRAVRELNTMLEAYLPHTSDISNTVPVNRIYDDFMKHAGDFKPEPETPGDIDENDIGTTVEVLSRDGVTDDRYRAERNTVVVTGRSGRLRAVNGDDAIVEIRGSVFGYSKPWRIESFAGTPHEILGRHSSLAYFKVGELGIVRNRKPSPVHVHQYKKAVQRMHDLLLQHRVDNSGKYRDHLVASGDPHVALPSREPNGAESS